MLHAADAKERELLWKCRKMAVGAVGRLSPSYCIQDGVVPRTQLPHILRRIAEIAAKYGVRIVNVAHAGDGNVHPILLFDERDPEQVERVLAASGELLEECIACGGSVTAEHGIGVEKIDFMDRLFAPADLEAMRRVRQAFDPSGCLNPGKLIPERRRNPKMADNAILPLDRNDHARPTRRRWPRPWPTPCARTRRSIRSAAATALDYGARPTRPGIGLSLAKLNRVVDYPARDLTITVEAGLTIAALRKRLAAERQRLPVDVPQAGSGHRRRRGRRQPQRPAAVPLGHDPRLRDRHPRRRRHAARSSPAAAAS